MSLNDIKNGFSERNYKVIEDRDLAIKDAIEKSEEDAVVLIAGKGHETYQEINGERSYFSDKETALSWAVIWERGDRESINESYVNLIPTMQGGTHVAGMRSGITDAIKEFYDYRKLIPKGVKVTPDDVWKNCSFILSAKLKAGKSALSRAFSHLVCLNKGVEQKKYLQRMNEKIL